MRTSCRFEKSYHWIPAEIVFHPVNGCNLEQIHVVPASQAKAISAHGHGSFSCAWNDEVRTGIHLNDIDTCSFSFQNHADKIDFT